MVDPTPGDQCWCYIQIGNGGDNLSMAYLSVVRGRYADTTRREVRSTAAHELVHAMNWAMSKALDPLTDHLSTSQMSMAQKLLKRGNEQLAYKWEAIVAEWFKADAPPDEVP